MKRSLCGMAVEHIPHVIKKGVPSGPDSYTYVCDGALSLDISDNPCGHLLSGEQHGAHTWNDRHDVYWCTGEPETENIWQGPDLVATVPIPTFADPPNAPVQQHISTIGNFSVCTRCGVLIAEEFGAVHDRYHSEPRTITVQLPSL